MYKLIKLILYRIKHNKAFLITYLVLIPIIIALAIYFTNSISHTIQIGIVGDIDTSQNSQIKYTYLDTLPSTSELVLNQYDAIIVQDDKNIDVLSTKGETYNQTITLLINGQIDSLPVNDNQRGSASNILGFLMMVILLLGGQIYKYYFDERTGINKRILSTSVSCYQYLLSHFIVVYIFLFIPATIIICSALFVFKITLSIAQRILSTSVSCYQYLLSHFIVVYIFLFIPATIIICSALFVFKITLSIAPWKFILILALLCFFATSFGLWSNVLSKSLEESMMFGNMFAIIGTIVSGWKFILILALLCFFATSFGLWSNVLSKSLEESMMFGNMFAIIGTIVSGGITQVTNNEIFNYVVQFFPQKQVMTTLSALENKNVLPTSGIIYSLLLSLVLIISAIVIEKRKLSVR